MVRSVGTLGHMLMFGWLTATVGILLFHVGLTMTLRANQTTRVPFYRNAEIVPSGSVAMRAIGAGLIVLGAVLLSTHAWYWPLAIVLAGPSAALAVIALHNKKAAAA